MSLFSKQVLLVGVILLAHQALGMVIQKRDVCNIAPTVPNPPTYGFSDEPGPYFCDTAWDKGIVLTGLEVWSDELQIKALQWSYSDGTKSIVRGQIPDPSPENPFLDAIYHAAITWDQTDTVKSIQTWSTDFLPGMEPRSIRRIKVITNGGMNMEAGGASFSQTGSGESVSVDSGILIRGNGIGGDAIHSLQWQFLSSKVAKATMIDAQWDESLDSWNQKQQGLTSTQIDSGLFRNDSPAGSPNQTFSFTSTKTLTSTKEFSQSDTRAGGMSVSVEVAYTVTVPALVGTTVTGKIEGHWELTHMSGSSTSDSDTETITRTQGGTMAPGHAADCTVTSTSGKFTSLYTATIQIELASCQVCNIIQRATYTASGWTDAVTSCRDISLEEASHLVASGARVLLKND